jgi:pilus assembly protein CpaB
MGIRVVLLGIVILSGIGLVIAYFYNPNSTGPGAPHPHMIAVAAMRIETGALINPQMLKFAPPPENFGAQAGFDEPQAGPDGNQQAADGRALAEISGAVARHRIEENEPILHGSVLKPGDSGFLAAVLQPGMRAVTVDVTARTSSGGLVFPGDRVDVLLTQNFNNAELPLDQRTASEIAATDLRVLAIDQRLQANIPPNAPDTKVPATVTLEVDPAQAQRISVASKLGELTLAVRSLQSPVGPAGDTSGPGDVVRSGDVSVANKQTSQAIATANALKGNAGPKVMIVRGAAAETVTTQALVAKP